MKKTFKKNERLCSKKVIDSLFDRKNLANESVFSYPIKAIISPTPENQGTQVLFSVSKKQFKNAVDRNQIKRRMKEAFRLNKEFLKGNFYIGFMYVGKEIEDFLMIEKGMKGIFRKAKSSV